MKKALDEIDSQIADETKDIASRYEADATLEKVALVPKRGRVDVQFVTLGWKAK